MPRLRLIAGPPGSGKTTLMLREVAARALEQPLGPPAAPALLVLVPEQQTALTERAVLEAIAQAQGTPTAASSRVQVVSFKLLARRLEQAAGQHGRRTLSEQGRRMLLWRILGSGAVSALTNQRQESVATGSIRTETATMLSGVLAELQACAIGPLDLRVRAAELGDSSAGSSRLKDKLAALAEASERYQQACAERGIAFAHPASRIPELLTDANWPLLAGTEMWVDGFRDFQPAEERALVALLSRTKQVTAMLMLDPARLDGPLDADDYDGYAPSRAQYVRWNELAQTTGAEYGASAVQWLTELHRWSGGSKLAGLVGARVSVSAVELVAPASVPAKYSANPSGKIQPPQRADLPRPDVRATADSRTAVPTETADAVVCADSRAEVDAAARCIGQLVLPPELGGRGMRYGDISVVVRSLGSYAGLIRQRFADHGIQLFVDQRRSLAQHPVTGMLDGGLRLALGLASTDDACALLKCGLLPGGLATRERADALEEYAREVGLRPREWLGDQPWTGVRSLTGGAELTPEDVARLEELDSWRRELLAPVIELASRIAVDGSLTVEKLLTYSWIALFTPAVSAELEIWARQAETDGQPDAAEVHRNAISRLAGLLEEMVSLAGDVPVIRDTSKDSLAPEDQRGNAAATDAFSPAELCVWAERALAELDVGFPPPRLDSVLVTDIERGRHGQVRATLLLGMAEGLWPPSATQSSYFSDAEREQLNMDWALQVSGPRQRADAEAFLALVAATRPSEYLYISRPAADEEGRARTASPYYHWICDTLGLAERQLDGSEAGLDAVGTPAELVLCAGLIQGAALEDAARKFARSEPDAWRGLSWARGHTLRLPPLTSRTIGELLNQAPGGGPVAVDIRQLQEFAACPFKHYSRRLLRLQQDEAVGLRLGPFYHEILRRLALQLNARGFDWRNAAPGDLRDAAREVLAELAGGLGTEAGDGALHLLERADWLLSALAVELAGQAQSGRQPAWLGVRYGVQGAPLPAVEVSTSRVALRVTGRIDRVDITPDGAATVVDYKLTGGKLDWSHFLAGEEIELAAALLAVDGARIPASAGLAPFTIYAANAEVQRIEPEWDKDDTANFRPLQLRRTDYAKEASACKVERLVPRAMEEAHRILAELGERLLAGEIAARPLRHGRWTACSECGLRQLCRHDPAAGDPYRDAPAGRELHVQIAAGEADFTGSAS